MNHELQATTVSGEITEVFAHRFIVRTPTGNVLADLGPKGAELVAIRPGARVEITGEQKPSELKVRRITSGDRTVDIEHKKKDGRHGHGGEPGPADPAVAIEAVIAKGFEPVGEPRRKPRHFEILARDPSGTRVELHVGHDGSIHDSRSIDPTDRKWAAETAKVA